MFITFEGGEGSGKSTQAKFLADRLAKNNHKVILTREPGGTELAEELRKLVVAERDIDNFTEAMIFMTARADHWFKVIKPNLDNGYIVICDRFHDSTLVYQGVCGKISIDLLNNIYNSITDGIIPDRTYIFDVEPEIGLKRAFARHNDETRFENKSIEYHKSIRTAYLDLAKTSSRYKIINASLSIDEISKIIWGDIDGLITSKN